MRNLLTTLLMLALLPAHGADWQVYTHSLGNQAHSVDGTLHGVAHAGKRAFHVELVRELLKEVGLPDEMVEVPLARGLLLLQSRPHVVLFNLSRAPDREHLVHWVGPTLEETDYLYELKAQPTGIREIGDATALTVCVLNGSSHDRLLVARGFTRLRRANSYAGCFRMLAAGRVRLVASADSDLASKLADAGVNADQVTPSAVSLGQDRGYIALSRQTSAEDVQRWCDALERLKRDGRYQQLHAAFVH